MTRGDHARALHDILILACRRPRGRGGDLRRDRLASTPWNIGLSRGDGRRPDRYGDELLPDLAVAGIGVTATGLHERLDIDVAKTIIRLQNLSSPGGHDRTQ